MSLSSSFQAFSAMLRRIGAGAMLLAAMGAGAVEPGNLESAPLAARTGPGPMGFTVLSPERTGLTAVNRYDDPAMWAQRYREFSLGAIGTGVAIADFDGDGRPDIFVACKTGPNHLYRNLGDFRFEDVTAHAGVAGAAGPWNQGAAWADVNNDGWPDLYVCRFGAPNLLYLNHGDGTFIEEAAARGLALNDASNMAAFCDYDRDGWLDVYLQTNLLDAERHPNGQRDRLYHNNRDGTFAEVTGRAGITGETQGHAATWWDYDEDGWPDLYVDNDFRDPDQLYHNNRDGTFTNVLSRVVPHTPHSSMGADLGDLNNDGHVDLLVADMAATTREKDHRGMAKLRAGLTEDEEHPGAAPQFMRNALFLGTGTDRVLEAAELAGLAATDWTWSVRLEDLDNDGRLDVFITNGMVRELHNADLTQRMMTRESLAERVRLSKAAPPLAERHLTFRNLGELRFEETAAAWGLAQTGVAFGAAFADLDGDGDLDLVYANMDAPVTVCRNESTGGHAVVVALRGTTSNRFGVGATVRIETAQGVQLRTLTLARGYLSTSEPVLHFGLGEDTVIRSLAIEWPGGARQTFADLAADRRYTVTEPTGAAAAALPPAPLFRDTGERLPAELALREKPLDEWAAQPLLPFRLNRPGPAVAAADFDRDGWDDLAVGGVTGEPGRLLSNLGDGEYLVYGSNLFPETRAPDGPIVALDANADGQLDLLVTKAGVALPADHAGYEPRLLLNGGRSRFTAAAGLLPSFPVSVGAAAAADFEHSGHPGVFLGGRTVPGDYGAVPRSALWAWRDGRYVDVTAEVAPGLSRIGRVTAALWTDVDDDGWLDLLVACEWGPVSCFRNLGGRAFEDATAKLGFNSGGTGWWHALAVADFNGDGRPDFAAGNTGLNTRYRASAEWPALLYAGVTAGGAPQLVEAEAADGAYYPLRDRDTLAKLLPAALRPFPTTDAFAKARLEDIFPADRLASATKLAVTELRNGVFLSQPDGTWRFTPLPALAQIAPIQAMVAGDIDGDGRADLLAVGNSFAPTPETGRFDGGLGWLLRGDGRGGFAAVPPRESGFIVPGDARGLVVLDPQARGGPAFIVLRNNARALRFTLAAADNRAGFWVDPRGPAGDPLAVGARLTLTLADGATRMAEKQAGPVPFPDVPGNPPVRLKVRWPDGRVSEHTFPAPPRGRLVLSAP
jgi:hypothetical protein